MISFTTQFAIVNKNILQNIWRSMNALAIIFKIYQYYEINVTFATSYICYSSLVSTWSSGIILVLVRVINALLKTLFPWLLWSILSAMPEWWRVLIDVVERTKWNWMGKFDFWDRAGATSRNMRYLVHYFTTQFVNRNILAAVCAFDVLTIIFYDLYKINITFAMSL